MSRPGRQLALPVIALALLAAGGCLGSPASTVAGRPKARTAARAALTPTPAPLPTIGTPTTPRLVSRTPEASRTPSVTRSPGFATPTPGLPYPDVAIQPVALNPTDSIGLAADTLNFMVVSAAIVEGQSRVEVSADDDDGPSRFAASYGLRAVEAADPHVAFQRAQRALPLPPPEAHRAARYGLAATLSVGASVPFWVIKSFEGEEFDEVQITAKVLEVGQHCYVVVDQDALTNTRQAAIIAGKAKEIVKAFDEQIYPTNTRIFGAEPNPGIDGDSRVYILLSPAVGNYGKDTTLGYFSQRDEFSPRAGSSPVFKRSNQKEMLYVSSRIVQSGSADDYLGTIAHEFQHMINFNQKVLVAKNRASDDLWIDEGMAMYAIEANGYGVKAGGEVLANHVKRFMSEPEAFSLTEWKGNPEGIGYGPVYMFMVYLADRFGEGIIKEIVTSAKTGIPNFDAVLKTRGLSLARVFHDWTLANMLDGRKQVSSQHLQYASLEVSGTNGATKLPGFEIERLELPARFSMPMRPYSARYYRLPDGLLAPKFTLTAGSDVKAGAVPRLVLPQDEF